MENTTNDRMYRKHGDRDVVDVANVWPIIPVSDPEYVAWLALGNRPLEQDDPNDSEPVRG